MAVDGVSYEELEFLHYAGSDVREVLFDIVAAINQGKVHDSALGRPPAARDREAGRQGRPRENFAMPQNNT